MRTHSWMILPLFVMACEPEIEGEETACAATSGNICTYLGIPGVAQFTAEELPPAETATYLPMDGLIGPDGLFYFIDFNNHRIRRVDDDGLVRTIAGSGFLGDGPQGDALYFAFNHPTDMMFHPDRPNELWVAAWHNSRINVVDLDGGDARYECATGARDFGGDGGDAKAGFLDLPASIVFDEDKNLYVSDQANQAIRKVSSADNTISTIAGKIEERVIGTDPVSGAEIRDTKGWPGYAGDDGPATEARFHASVGQAADPSSRIAYFDREVYIADTENNMIRAIDLDSGLVRRVAGKVETRAVPQQDGTTLDVTKGWPGYAGDGGDALDAVFSGPRDLEIAADGTIYVADTHNHCVRKIDTSGVVSTVAGVCGEQGFDGDGGPATEALMNEVYGIELAADGTLYIADAYNHVFRIVYP